MSRSSSGTRSRSTSSATPATAPRDSGGVQQPLLARSAITMLLRAPSTSRPLAVEEQRLVGARRARRVGRERVEQPVGQLVASGQRRRLVELRRADRAPDGRIVAEPARDADQRAARRAVARDLESHRAFAAGQTPRGQLVERAAREHPDRSGRGRARCGAALEAAQVLAREARASARRCARSCSSRALGNAESSARVGSRQAPSPSRIHAGSPRCAQLDRRAQRFVERDVVLLRRPGVDLARAPDLEVRVAVHLHPLRDPAGQAAEREDRREHVGRRADRVVDHARVEVDVRVELALDEVVVLQRDLLELDRDLEQLGASRRASASTSKQAFLMIFMRGSKFL